MGGSNVDVWHVVQLGVVSERAPLKFICDCGNS